MLFVISCQTDICIEIAKTEEKLLISILSDNFYPPKNLVVRRTTTSQFLVVLTHFLVVEDTRTREFCYPGHPSNIYIRNTEFIPFQVPLALPEEVGILGDALLGSLGLGLDAGTSLMDLATISRCLLKFFSLDVTFFGQSFRPQVHRLGCLSFSLGGTLFGHCGRPQVHRSGVLRTGFPIFRNPFSRSPILVWVEPEVGTWGAHWLRVTLGRRSQHISTGKIKLLGGQNLTSCSQHSLCTLRVT